MGALLKGLKIMNRCCMFVENFADCVKKAQDDLKDCSTFVECSMNLKHLIVYFDQSLTFKST